METGNKGAFKKKFHPRLRIKNPTIDDIFARIKAVSGRARPDVSIYRIWALNTVDGSREPLECAKDELSIVPNFGYPLPKIEFLINFEWRFGLPSQSN